MVITTFLFLFCPVQKTTLGRDKTTENSLCTTGEFESLPISGLDSFEPYLGAQFQKLRRGNPLDLRIFLLIINFWIFQSCSMSVFIDLGFASPTGCPFLKRKGATVPCWFHHVILVDSTPETGNNMAMFSGKSSSRTSFQSPLPVGTP